MSDDPRVELYELVRALGAAVFRHRAGDKAASREEMARIHHRWREFKGGLSSDDRKAVEQGLGFFGMKMAQEMAAKDGKSLSTMMMMFELDTGT